MVTNLIRPCIEKLPIGIEQKLREYSDWLQEKGEGQVRAVQLARPRDSAWNDGSAQAYALALDILHRYFPTLPYHGENHST